MHTTVYYLCITLSLSNSIKKKYEEQLINWNNQSYNQLKIYENLILQNK